MVLLGDFNARTSNISDIADVDQSIFDYVNIDTSDVFDSNLREKLKINTMNFERCSKDGTVNRLGRQLIDFCRTNDLTIINGRAYADKIGNFTC